MGSLSAVYVGYDAAFFSRWIFIPICSAFQAKEHWWDMQEGPFLFEWIHAALLNFAFCVSSDML